MDPARIFQLNKIVARLSNHDMAQFKFAKQFGLTGDTHQILINLFTQDKKLVQDILSKLPEEELMIAYIFTKMCQDRLLNKNSYPGIIKIYFEDEYNYFC